MLNQLCRYDDERGSLVVLDQPELPFPVRRIFWIFDVPEGQTRANHRHETCRQALVAVRGSFWVRLTPPGAGLNENTVLSMCNPAEALFVPAGVHIQLFNFSADAVCLVLANEAYDAEEAIP